MILQPVAQITASFTPHDIEIMAEDKKTAHESKQEPQQSNRKIDKNAGYTIPVQMF